MSSSQTFNASSWLHPRIQIALSLVSTPSFSMHYLYDPLPIIKPMRLAYCPGLFQVCILEPGRGPGIWLYMTNAGEMNAGINEFSYCLVLCLNSSRQVLLKVCFSGQQQKQHLEKCKFLFLLPPPTLHQPESLRVGPANLCINKPSN